MVRSRRILAPLGLAFSFIIFGSTAANAAWSPGDAVSYADRYAVNPNSAYPVYASDCTNFVSQALRYGGHPQLGTPTSALLSTTSQWWMNGTGPGRTTSWSIADNLETFIGAHDTHADGGRVQLMGSQTNYLPSPVGPGDPVFYVWDNRVDGFFNHVALVTGTGTDPTSKWVGHLVDTHSTNRLHAIWHLRPYNSKYPYTTTAEFHLS